MSHALECEAFAQGAGGSAEAVERAIEGVFSDPALRRGLTAGDGGLSTLDALWEQVRRFLRAARDELLRLQLDSPVLYWLIMLGLVLALVLILFHVVITLSLAMRGGQRRSGETGNGVTERERRFRELRDEARALAGDGRFRDAVRSLLLALLALVEERRVLRGLVGKTNREILSRLSVGGVGEMKDELRHFGRSIEAAAYGGAVPSEAEFKRLDGVLDRMSELVRPAEGAGAAAT